MMNSIKIVEYHPRLAKKVAEMWNKSQEGWGNSNSIMTEEQVLQKEATSGNLNLYLALEGEDVVGYCGLSEYREDEGALYIPLLNVRDDYHGKKIGKALVLKAIERTIELGWPRLDLYTWSGNTKAVPLYKRCGFFWEERDDSTHLMNFIPTVLNTAAVADFFDQLDWYQDNTRLIEIKPDGRREGDFEFFEYRWQKDGANLRMEFERTGRGLRLIETDDYLISVSLEDFKIVFGSSYSVRYQIKNKSGKPLEITLQGMDHKNISYSFSEHIEVEEEKILEGYFFVNPITEEQSTWRTHPTVKTAITINGKEALFQVGIRPLYPAKISIQQPNNQCFLDISSQLYLEVENQFNEEVEFNIRLPKSEIVQLEQDYFQLRLKAKEKLSLPLSYRLKQFGFYSGEAEVKVRRETEDELPFTKHVAVPFKGLGARFGGECDEYWHIYNGLFQVVLQKFNNAILPSKETVSPKFTYMMYPKLGKPYSLEFSKTKPIQVEILDEAGAILLKATYQSRDFPELQLINMVKLYSEGIVEQWYEVKNLAQEETSQEVWITHSLSHQLERAVIPYDGKIITLADSYVEDYDYWEGSRWSENWIFSQSGHSSLYSRGISWPQEYKMNSGWILFFEIPLGRIPGGGSLFTKPFYTSIGAYQNWEEFRAFALKGKDLPIPPITNHLELEINHQNPFTYGESKATLIDYKKAQVDGSVELYVDDQPTPLTEKTFTHSGEVVGRAIDLFYTATKPIQHIKVVGQFEAVQLEREGVSFTLANRPIHCTEIVEHGMEVYSVDNGVLQLKVAPAFAPSLVSLLYEGKEILDHPFPEIKPKSWWNPWVGGIQNRLIGLSLHSILKEERKASFVTLRDQHQNEWTGIKIEVEIKEAEEFKGLLFNQYFLLLPGLPLLCHTTEIVQNTNHYFQGKEWYTSCFLKTSSQGAPYWVKTIGKKEGKQRYTLEKGGYTLNLEEGLVYGNGNGEQFLQIITDGTSRKIRAEYYMYKDISHLGISHFINLSHGERFFTKPLFFLFHDRTIPDQALISLKNIRFDLQGGEVL